MKNRITAEKFFHTGTEKLNCAQAVLKAFQKKLNIHDSVIDEFRAYGGGRAAEGICGALYAAEYLAEKHNYGTLKEHFANEAGHTKCRELKQHAKTSCVSCVKIADTLLAKKITTKE